MGCLIIIIIKCYYRRIRQCYFRKWIGTGSALSLSWRVCVRARSVLLLRFFVLLYLCRIYTLADAPAA